MWVIGLLLTVLAQGAETPLDHDKVSYLNSVNVKRLSEAALVVAEGEVVSARAIRARDAELFQMQSRLTEKKASTQEELDEAHAAFKESDARVIQTEKRVDFLKAQREAHLLEAAFHSGQSVALRTIYDQYRRAWTAHCEEAEAMERVDHARVELADRKVQRARVLYARQALSRAELLEREAQVASTQAMWEARDAYLRRCTPESFPSYEEVEKCRRTDPLRTALPDRLP